MPPQIQAILENRNAMIAIVAVLVVLTGFAVFAGTKGEGNQADKKLEKTQLEFMKDVEPAGKAVAIQAMLSDHGIRVDREAGDGGKSTIRFQEGATQEQRDNALMILVKSGLVDANMGLEMFDKGDITASSEDKRIRLIRAQQGELARLIKRFNTIEDASVAITIPDKSVFKSQNKPLSVSIQVKTISGDRVDRDVVRSIINLAVASLQDVSPDRVALTDTNGNVYNSVLNTSMEMQDKLKDQDQYMKQKVAAQLDHIIGRDKYVVTVSTHLREVTRETLTQTFDPQQSAVATKQSFTENLNSNGTSGTAGGATSSFLPGSMSSSSGGGSNSKGYNRSGVEIAYENARVQSLETSMPGVIEDISIAVTVDKNRFANSGLDMDALSALVANAASPKVLRNNVSILTADFNEASRGIPLTAASGETQSENTMMAWVPWAGGSVLALALLMVVMSLAGGQRDSRATEETQREIQELRELTMQQQAQISATQRQAQQLVEQTTQAIPSQASSGQSISQLKKTLEEVKEAVQEHDDGDEELDVQIKNWIESS